MTRESKGVNIIPDDESITNVFCFGAFADKISGVVYNNLTGNFPFMSIDGSVCFFVLYHYELNAILVKPIANVDDRSIYEAYKEVFETLEAKGYKPKMNVMDNQATKYINKFLTKKECELQVVEPHNHRVNAANGGYKHSRMHLLRPSQRPIVTSHSNYGINWHCKSKTHSTYSGHCASTRIYPHTKL
jgi:hypothetical protein